MCVCVSPAGTRVRLEASFLWECSQQLCAVNPAYRRQQARLGVSILFLYLPLRQPAYQLSDLN